MNSLIIRRIIDFSLRIIVGSVFVLSGFVKAVDPLGSAYKFGDYFEAFNIEAISPFALPLAFLLSAVEFSIGFALILNFLKKFTSWLLLSFIVYFTGLTLVIALTNPVSDCGCFGDAIKISNWATLYKNIVLLVFSVYLLLHNNLFENRFYAYSTQRVLWLFFFVFSICISIYSVSFLPILDFRPYKIGVNIFDAMSIPDNAPKDEFKTTLYYEKDGNIKGFSEEDYPWQDTTWHYVEVENELIKKGYEPPIKNFNILNELGEDIGLDIILEKNYQFMITVRDINKLDASVRKKILDLTHLSQENGFSSYIVSSVTNSEIHQLKTMFGGEISVYQADEILLKTIIRASTGVIVFREGTIVGKFNLARTKVDDKFNGILEYTLDRQRVMDNRYNVLTLGLIFIIILLVYLNIEKKY